MMSSMEKQTPTKGKKLPYKQRTPLADRVKMVDEVIKKGQNTIVVIVEKHPKCLTYENFHDFKYYIKKDHTLLQIYNKIRSNIVEAQKKYESMSIFIFSKNRVLNKETSFEEIYDKNKDKEDGILYLTYASVESF